MWNTISTTLCSEFIMSSLKMSDSDPTLFQGLNLRSLLENSDLLSTVTHASESLVRFFVFFDAVSPPLPPHPVQRSVGHVSEHAVVWVARAAILYAAAGLSD